MLLATLPNQLKAKFPQFLSLSSSWFMLAPPLIESTINFKRSLWSQMMQQRSVLLTFSSKSVMLSKWTLNVPRCTIAFRKKVMQDLSFSQFRSLPSAFRRSKTLPFCHSWSSWWFYSTKLLPASIKGKTSQTGMSDFHQFIYFLTFTLSK